MYKIKAIKILEYSRTKCSSTRLSMKLSSKRMECFTVSSLKQKINIQDIKVVTAFCFGLELNNICRLL